MSNYIRPSVEVLGQLHDLTLVKLPYGKTYASNSDGLFALKHGVITPIHS